MKKTTTGKARILVADDHPLFREGVIQLVNRQADMACCAECTDGAGTTLAVSEHAPDLLLLDLRLGQEDGLELIKSLKARFPTLAILIVSQFDETLYAERTLRAGALGYVMKDEATEELLVAVRSALAGEPFVSRKMASLLLRRSLQSNARTGVSGVSNLSDREVQVFQRLGASLSTRQIAEELKLSLKTIETYRENIKHKLGLTTAQELVGHATEWVQSQGPQ